MSLSRRELLKTKAAGIAALAANVSGEAVAQPVAGGVDALKISWSKAPCRFCGTGCGVMVGVKDGKVIATHGDMKAEVNRGLNCVKGYFLSKIMYGADRLTQPLLRKAERHLRQGRRVHAGLLGRGLRHHGGAGQARPEGEGADRARHVRLRPVDDLRRLCRDQADSGRASARTISDPNARHCMASAAYAFMRTFGMDEPMGCYDDFEHADAFVLWGSNMAEMHPILWTRVTDRRLGHPHVKVAVLSTFTHRSSDLADIPIVFKPGTDLAILNYIANHIISTGRVNRDFVDKHTTFVKGATDIGYGLRPDDPREVKAKKAEDVTATRRRSISRPSPPS